MCTSQEKNIGMTKAFQFFSRQFIESHVNATVKMPFQHHFTSYVYICLSLVTPREFYKPIPVRFKIAR